MEEESLYDEFGNYIGPDIMENDNEDLFQDLESEEDKDNEMEEELDYEKKDHRVVLHEDKKYYPDAEEVYPGAEMLIQEEDTQALEDPLIDLKKEKFFAHVESDYQTNFSYKFLQDMMNTQESIRNVAIVGHLHHGKTTLIDNLVEQTHVLKYPFTQEYHFTDESSRKISIKSSPVSLILQDSKEKSFLLNLIDTPGHPNFFDEVSSALRICDGALLIVDVIEGMMSNSERILKYCIQERIPVAVVMNKIDRLALELKLPPADAYLKIKHNLDEINGILKKLTAGIEEYDNFMFSPLKGNVLFASSLYGFSFTLESFAKIYSKNIKINQELLTKILYSWGDLYYNRDSRKVMRNASKEYPKRTFVEFILEPMYKLMTRSVSRNQKDLMPILSTLGVYLYRDEYKLDAKELLKIVCQRFFGNSSPIVQTVNSFIPNSHQGNKSIISKYYLGNRSEDIFSEIAKGTNDGPLYINIVKLYNRPNGQGFDAFGRVLSGTLLKGQALKVLGPNYSIEDDEDMALKPANKLWIYQTRYKVEADRIPAGNWVLIEGIEESIIKEATCISANEVSPLEILKPIKLGTTSVIKLAIEPLVPSELPKMIEGLRKINKTYPALTSKVEESGEHVICGTGELYLDSCMHDLREIYSKIEIKVSDPSVKLNETVIDTSALKCSAETANKRNKISMISSPLDKDMAEEIEEEKMSLNWESKKLSSYLETNYDWDILASRSLWAFGPDDIGPNILLNDTLPSETDQDLLKLSKAPIVQGFQWATREGPLCDEPVRNVKFKLIDGTFSEDFVHRSAGQIIPTARRVAYSSFLTATPRLMEPMLICEVLCTSECLSAIYTLIGRRRGHLISEAAKPGTPLYIVKVNIPAIDSFGFETDIRIHTSGQAFVLSTFDHWSLLPGDPLDKSIVLKTLEPSEPYHLAREFLIKTRRRKGLNEDVSILKYFDDPALVQALKDDESYSKFI